MISVVIPTLNSAQTLAQTFASLVSPTVSGLVREVIVTDGGSTDETIAIAEAAGAKIVTGAKGRGQQLARGAAEAKEPFLLFLHSDTGLEPGWDAEVTPLVEGALAGEPMRGVPGEAKFAAAFRFLLKDHSRRARLLEKLVALRCAFLKAPYGDQGLLISRSFYDEVGGFADIALMEDVDLVRRIGRRRIVMLRSAALTSADKYQRSGYLLRILRNAVIMTLWVLRVPTRVLVRLYG
jgi:rSAM/selenodomain-associated transferase 2